MGNARLPLSEELHDLVRDVVEDLESAAVACAPVRAAPRETPATAAERRRVRQATILRLRSDTEVQPAPPPIAPSPPPPPATPAPLPPPPPSQPHRQRAYLARLDVASAVFTPRMPVRTRRLAVSCRRASPLDAARATRMLRIAVPTVVVEPRAPIASPLQPPTAWATLVAPARVTAPLEEPAAAPETAREVPGLDVRFPAPAEIAAQAAATASATVAVDVPDSVSGLAAAVGLPTPGSDLAEPAEAPQEPGPESRTAAAPLFADLRAAASTEARTVTLPAPVITTPHTRTSAAAPPAAWRGPLGHATNLLIAIALEIVVMVCATMVGLIVTGHHLEQVVTGSMQPTIPIGAIVLTERIPANQLTVGEVVVFPDPNKPSLTIVHRIVWLSHDSQGDVLIKTQGDYNKVVDNWTVKRPGTSFADRAIWVLPGGGTAAALLRAIGFFGLLALIIGFIGYQGWRQVRKVLDADDGDAVHGATEVAS